MEESKSNYEKWIQSEKSESMRGQAKQSAADCESKILELKYCLLVFEYGNTERMTDESLVWANAAAQLIADSHG